jgi:hypothetical protein
VECVEDRGSVFGNWVWNWTTSRAGCFHLSFGSDCQRSSIILQIMTTRFRLSALKRVVNKKTGIGVWG